jgi:hypothetical protein
VDEVARIADAVLYEGYLLWPYRRSALKNQRRWTFGGVYPEGHSRDRDDDPSTMRTQCLLEVHDPGDARVSVSVRFLHVVGRQVLAATPAGLKAVDELTVDGRRHLSWEEAVEREVATGPLSLGALAAGREVPVDVAAGAEHEELAGSDGAPAGRITRAWAGLTGSVRVAGEAVADGLVRVTVAIANATPWAGGPREAVLGRTFCSTHTVLRATGGAWVSLTDPPAALREAAEACRNEGTWPVLVGEPEARDTLLSSPIILEDHPRIAPESPGDLFDGGEIDQLLTLSILSLTDAEKAEMRDSDPRAREILERTEALSDEDLLRLNGRLAREIATLREP